MRDVFAYCVLVIKRALREFIDAFGWNKTTVIGILSYGVVLWLRYRAKGAPAMVEEWQVWKDYFANAIAPTLIAAAVVALLCIIKAAASIHKEQTENQSNQKRAGLYGEIKQVYFRPGYAPEGLDWYVLINLFLVNQGHSITVKEFRINLTVGERDYFGLTVPIRDLRLLRTEYEPGFDPIEVRVEDSLATVELSSHMLLEPRVGRDGWLQFRVSGIRFPDGPSVTDPMQIAVLVIDAVGENHVIRGSSPWRQNGRIVGGINPGRFGAVDLVNRTDPDHRL
jgi:hypothetical protein